MKGDTCKERSNYQLDEWVNGNPIHNDTDNECCPDFSCCNPKFLQPLEIRKTFREICKKANEEEFKPNHHPYYDAKMGMLMTFIGNIVNESFPEKKIHIIDGNVNHKKEGQ